MRLNSSIKHYSDKLIYDSSHEIDAGVFTVTLPTESKAAGTVKRGQIIYFDTTKKEYVLIKGDDCYLLDRMVAVYELMRIVLPVAN